MCKGFGSLRYVIPVVVLLVSVSAVWARLSGYRGLPPVVSHELDWFQGPGEIVWWLAMGHAFQAYPNTLAGYSVLSLSNTAIWMGAVCLVRWLVARFL